MHESESPALILRIDRVRGLCESAGIESMKELAVRIGVAPSTLWRIEHGLSRPSPQVIARIKLAFPLVSFDELIEAVAA